MTSMQKFTDIPDLGGQFVDTIYQYLFQLSGQSRDIDFIECTLYSTFTLAKTRIAGFPVDEQQKMITREWLLQLAEEAFTRQLLHRLSIEPTLYFELLYSAFHQKVRYSIAALLKKPENDTDVEDCVQDTFMKVFRSMENRVRQGVAMPVYPFTGWLYRVAQSVCYDYWEKQKHRPSTFSLEEQPTLLEQESENEREQPDIYAELKEREERVHACVERLPEPCRTYIKLFYYNGLALAEIAAQANLPIGKVRTCIYQLAVRRFRKLWYEENGE